MIYAIKTVTNGSANAGSVLIESLIVLPLLLLLTLGILQYSLIYHAKSSLDYATFMSARAGAVDHISKNSVLTSFITSLSPLLATGNNSELRVSDKMADEIIRNTIFQIVNPTIEAFIDFAEFNQQASARAIPNHKLHVAPTKKGQRSQLNLQDVNLLKLRVIYGYELKVPFVNTIIVKTASLFMNKTIELEYLKNNRFPIFSTAIVRMQSPSVYNSWVQSRDEAARW